MMLSPTLRFKEFSGEWESKVLGEIGSFKKGKGLPKSDITKDGHPCIRYGELYTHYGEVISKIVSKTNNNIESSVIGYKNDVLIPSSGETAYDIATASALDVDNVILGGDINIFTPNTKNSGSFLAFSIEGKYKASLMKYAEGASVVHLYNNELRKFQIKLPTISEQIKIANFFILLDRRIEQQRKKVDAWCEYKKGMMQKLFSRELRFKDEDGREFREWEEARLLNVASVYQSQTISQDQLKEDGFPVYGANGIIGFYEKYNHENEQIALTCRGNTCGAINYTQKRSWITGNAMVINVDDNNSVIDKKYLYYLLLNYNFQSIISGSGQPQITRHSMNKIVLSIPQLEEQQTISAFLSAHDKKIEIETEKLEGLQEQKKGFMQQMFI